MVLLTIGEPIVFILLCIFIITQVIIPPFINKPFFWIFNKTNQKINKEETEIMNLLDEEKLLELIKKKNTIKKHIK